MFDEFRKVLQEFSDQSPTLCLSTCSADGQPHSSLIYFGLAEGATLYFFSKKETRKSKNMEENPKIALLAQNAPEQKSLQMEGLVKKVIDSQEKQDVFDFLIRNLSQKINWPPPAGKMDSGELIFYKVELTWARLGHFKDHERDIFTQLIG